MKLKDVVYQNMLFLRRLYCIRELKKAQQCMEPLRWEGLIGGMRLIVIGLAKTQS